MIASEHWGVVLDIMTMAKGITSGYAPMGAAITGPKVTRRFDSAEGRESGLIHVISFGGHAAASAAALKNIEILENEKMVENSAEMGAYMLAAVELVKDKKTREPFSPADQMPARVTAHMMELGLIG